MNSLKLTIGILAVATAAFCQGDMKKVTKSEGSSAVVSKVDPPYPSFAKQLKIQGTVELEAVVSETGVVEKVTVVNGNPVLTKPASDALMRWKYAPFQADGKPVKAVVPVSFNFVMR